jgi:hypothetical protein
MSKWMIQFPDFGFPLRSEKNRPSLTSLIDHDSVPSIVESSIRQDSHWQTIKMVLFREGSVVGRHGISSGCLLTFNT